MHWETNGHLGGMPLQLYHLITPGVRGMTARDCVDGRLNMEKKLISVHVHCGGTRVTVLH